jgi:hypothetical protein
MTASWGHVVEKKLAATALLLHLALMGWQFLKP